MAKEYFQGEVFDALDPGGVLREVEYNDCTFKNCRWDGVRIENCSFLSCTFEHCTWSGVVFSFSQMSDAWFSGCAFRSVAWGGLQGRSALVQPFGKAERCEFRYNEFSGMTLTRFDFSSCRFGDCTFDDCKLAGADFRGVPLGRTQFSRCDLEKADFREATDYAIDPTDNRLRGARFSFPDVVALLSGFGLKIE